MKYSNTDRDKDKEKKKKKSQLEAEMFAFVQRCLKDAIDASMKDLFKGWK